MKIYLLHIKLIFMILLILEGPLYQVGNAKNKRNKWRTR